MKQIVMYYSPEVVHKGTKAEIETIAQWEVFLDTGGSTSLPFGYVTMQYYATRPTKRQIRALKKQHRRSIVEAIEAREWEDSWEGIHCDIIGL
ncbi:hypothetical protein CPT_CIP9_136 [Enterobacter phage vB_EclM_CIP9]|uniref:Uncharacterized protein n=1 Tax=Enterobacter phage vB_EclM_CIP9 TaxID=2696340 RepID=A0A6B9Y141_9CAUD|nr:hypothetical protein HWD05_gp136 [Enterobacter phage vB_EclM_CIP9]QHS01672.1 hypothetical protein CPT_CIP9_136 [Enterobacter phage vB_EclM_CIP9]